MPTRRSFLTGALAAVAGASVATEARASTAPAQATGHTPRWGMVVDLRKCIGCEACTVACAMENALPVGEHRTYVPVYELESEREPSMAVLPRLCNHCENPPCIPVCPVEATYQKDDGTVVVNYDQCVGCGYCVQACPFGMRFLNEKTGTADKCTLCVQRTSVGLLPACVETCVGNARVFGDLHDPNSEVRKLIDSHETKNLRPEFGTRPQVYYIGLDDRLQDVVATGGGARRLRQAAGAEA